MIGGIDAAELREARRLTRLLDELVLEASRARSESAWWAKTISFAFVWLLPATAPLLVWRGEHGLAVAVLLLGVFLPAALRSSERTDRDEGLRLYGPAGEAVWLARLGAQLPWLAWAVLACAAVPVARVVGEGHGLDSFTVALAALTGALPLVRLSLGAGAESVSGPRKAIESLAPLVYAVTLVRVLMTWDPALPPAIGSELWILVAAALACTALACASRLARRLAPTPFFEPASAEASVDAGSRSADLGLPAEHSPARTAVGLELTLARLSFVARWRAAGGWPHRLQLAAGTAVFALFPFVVGFLCVVLLQDTVPAAPVPASPDGGGGAGGRFGLPGEARVSLLALWLGAILFGATRELSEGDWVRGVDWRTQLGLSWLRRLALGVVPAAIGCGLGFVHGDAPESSLAIAALVLAGVVLREAIGGLLHLCPDHDAGSWRTRWIGFAFFLVGVGFVLGLPVAHLFGAHPDPRTALWIAGGVSAVAGVGGLSDLFLRTEDVLGVSAANESDDDDEVDD